MTVIRLKKHLNWRGLFLPKYVYSVTLHEEARVTARMTGILHPSRAVVLVRAYLLRCGDPNVTVSYPDEFREEIMFLLRSYRRARRG